MRTDTAKTTEQTSAVAPIGIRSMQYLDALPFEATKTDDASDEDDQGNPKTVLTFERDDGGDAEKTLDLRTKDPDPADPEDTLVLVYEPPDQPLSPSDVTIEGTNGDDVIIGGELNESILGYDGEDLVHGGDGNDIISAHGGGGDVLYGDAGNDWLSAWNEDVNYLDGGSGDDRLLSHKGDDQLLGGVGNDEFVSLGGNNTMYGEDGNDELVGGSDEDMLFGGEGNDYLNGSDGQDTLTGGSDEDVFSFFAAYMNNKDTVTDFVIGEDRIDVFDLHNMDLAEGETLGDAMMVLDVNGGADVMALTTLHGWEVFAHFENVDAAALQDAIDDGSVFYEYGYHGWVSPIIGAQPFDFL